MKEKLGNIEYRPDLGMMVMEFYEDQITEFIGLQVMPLTPTPDKQGTFLVTPKEAMLKVYDTSRAPRGSYKRDDFEYERGLYDTVEQGWEEPVDDSERSGRSSHSAAGRRSGYAARNEHHHARTRKANCGFAFQRDKLHCTFCHNRMEHGCLSDAA